MGWNEMFELHEKQLGERYDKEALKIANVGWLTADDYISTKVYLSTGHEIFSTDINGNSSVEDYRRSVNPEL